MDTITVFLVLVILVCLYLFIRSRRKIPGMPPVAKGLPLVGNLLDTMPRDYVTFTRYRSYGELCVFHIGPLPAILLNSFHSIHEAFVGQADTFSGRPKAPLLDLMTHKSGIILQDGESWSELRRFVLRMMREFGMGRPMAEEIVKEECQALKLLLSEKQGVAIDSRQLFKVHTNNIIARFTFGEICADDDETKEFFYLLDKIAEQHVAEMIGFICPWILKVPILLTLFDKVAPNRIYTERMYHFIRKKTEQKQEQLQAMETPPTDLSEATNVCEAFLIEQAKQEAVAPGQHNFTDWQAIRIMFELFLAGTDTSSATLSWAILLLAVTPEVQKKAQLEIEEQIGTDRLPSMTDLKILPYVHAVIDEIFRFSSLIGTNVPHRATQDTHLKGFFIPKDMPIFSNFYGIHHDPEIWEKPDDFYPEHFLNTDGDYQPSKYLIPFSLGKRACPGESLARQEIFLVLVTILQGFDVQLAPSTTGMKDFAAETSNNGIRYPAPHEIEFVKRD